MHERSAVQNFDCGSGGECRQWILVAASLCHGEHQPRADAGASGEDSVAECIGQQRRAIRAAGPRDCQFEFLLEDAMPMSISLYSFMPCVCTIKRHLIMSRIIDIVAGHLQQERRDRVQQATGLSSSAQESAGFRQPHLLAARGEDVLVLERAAASGGKMRQPQDRWGSRHRWRSHGSHHALGLRCDLSPMPVRDAGRPRPAVPLPILARHAWTGTERLDLFADLARSADAIGSFAGAAEEARRFLAFSARGARASTGRCEALSFESQRPSPWGLAVANGGVSGLAACCASIRSRRMWKRAGPPFHRPTAAAALRALFDLLRVLAVCGAGNAHAHRPCGAGWCVVGRWRHACAGPRNGGPRPAARRGIPLWGGGVGHR